MSLAWQPLGFQPVFFSDFDPENDFPDRFLAHRFPDVPNLGDMTKIDGLKYRGLINVLWGSTPCQSFSLGGLRQGLKDPRGALTPVLVGLANDINPDFLCWENVDGALSDKDNAFGLFLAALSGTDEVLVPPGERWGNAGYVVGPERVVAWRLLDAQHFGLAQSRRRLFLVACPRNGADPRKVLFEPAALQAVAGQHPVGGPAGDAGADRSFDAFALSIRGRTHDGVKASQIEQGARISNCLRASQGGSDKGMVLTNQTGRWRARNMTPIECERVMGMPDDWTLIPKASDSARYHAIGNSIAVPCARFVGEGIARIAQASGLKIAA